MHIQTHVMSGWCVADLLNLSPRERALAMVAASSADLDGLGLSVSIDYYARYHPVLAHNFLSGLFLTIALTSFSTHRLKASVVYFALFHLQLVLDYFVSGPGWSISYFWPLSSKGVSLRVCLATRIMVELPRRVRLRRLGNRHRNSSPPHAIRDHHALLRC